MRKTYRLTGWRGWDKQVDACVRDFAQEFGVAPNLLVASPVFLRRVNVAANRAKVGNTKGEAPDASEYVELRGFVGEDYELLFVEEDEVPEKSFALIYAFGKDEETEVVATV